MTKISIKQQKFADAYISLGNATKAAIEAGYSKRYAGQNADKLLKNTNIAKYIEKRMKLIASKKIATASEVMEYLTTVLRGEAKETIVISTPFGADEVENTPNIKDRMTAGREILKRYPGNDEVSELELRKLKADAKRAEAEADIVKAEADQVKAIDSIGDDDDGFLTALKNSAKVWSEDDEAETKD